MYITKTFIEIINGRIIKREVWQMDIVDKSIIAVKPDTYLNELLSNMGNYAKKAYNNFSQSCDKEAIVIIRLCCFIRSSTRRFCIDENNSYVQIVIELRKNDISRNDNYYIENKDGISEIIEDTLTRLDDLFAEDRAKFDKKFLCKNICFSGKAAAILVHEYAHLFEADIYLYSRKYMNQFNPMLKLQDLCFHQHIPRFCSCFDDELINNKDFIILDNGLLRNIIVDKKWASIFHLNPKGNGRISFEEGAIVIPRMRITQISFDKAISDCKRNLKEDFLIIDNIRSGKLFPKEGVVTFNIDSSKYYSSQEIIKIKPFVISAYIHTVMNNIFRTSDDEYHMAYPCGKNGAQVPCGIVTPSEIYSLKDGINVLV